MVFWRELASGAILCVLCCAAVIYSFSPPAEMGVGAADIPDQLNVVARPDDTAMAAGRGQKQGAERVSPIAESDAPTTATVFGETASEPPVPVETQAAFEDYPAASDPADDEVRWLPLPAEYANRPFPVEAGPMPAIGREAFPLLEVEEPPAPSADDFGAEETVRDEGKSLDETPSGSGLLQPEFLATKPSLPDPASPGLLLSDPRREEPLERRHVEPGHPNTSAVAGPGSGARSLEIHGEDRLAEKAEHLTWQPPASLLNRIERLAGEPPTRSWAEATGRQIEALGPAMQSRSADTARLLATLEDAVADAMTLADQMNDATLAAELQRAAHALGRRLDVWQHADRLAGVSKQGLAAAPSEWDQLVLCLNHVEAHMGDSMVGQAWREYLLLDALRQWAVQRQDADESFGRELAQESLQRLTQIPMDQQQRHFVSSEPVNDLKAQLQRLAAAPIDMSRFLANLERYEQTRMAGDARLLARDYRRLAQADSEAERALAAGLATHYRNANVRFAVSESLLNRLMPTRDPEYAPVNDIVLGIPAQGRRTTSTEMQASLLPDPHRARLALDIHGQIYSQTTSSSGPATFLTNSLGSYIARKPLELGLEGIRALPAEVRVSNDLCLRGVRTDFDGLPLVGSLVNSVARSQHAQHRPAANAEIRAKIYHQAKSRIDQEAEERLAEVTDRLHKKVLEPMRRLRLDPVMIDAETTEDRLNMRIRLAGEEQLGSHTPRPRAPADSLASFQVHESAINNVLDQLDLAGSTFTLPELSRHVAQRLNNDGWLQVTPEHEEVSITFAAVNPVVVHCEDGRIGITLLIDRLRHDRRVWRDFQVEAFYKPETQGLSAELVRDGVIQLSGDRLPLGSQIALRGIFVRIFSRRRPWDLLPRPIAENRNLADLEITQFTIEDGWVGLALGPKRVAARVRRLLR